HAISVWTSEQLLLSRPVRLRITCSVVVISCGERVPARPFTRNLRARERDAVHSSNLATRPTRSAKADEVRCACDAGRSRTRLEWLHPEVQRNSRVAPAEYGLDTTHVELHGVVGNAVEDLLGLAPRGHEFCTTQFGELLAQPGLTDSCCHIDFADRFLPLEQQ